MAMTEDQVRAYIANAVNQVATDPASVADLVDGDPRISDADAERIRELASRVTVTVTVFFPEEG